MRMTTISIDVKAKTERINFKRNLDLGLPLVWFLQAGTWKIGYPQSASFSMKDAAVKFAKGPFLGISPDSLLKDKFK